METITRCAESGDEGRRLDQFVVALAGGVSRADVQRQIRAGLVLVDGRASVLPSRRLRQGETVVWQPQSRDPLVPKPLPLDIVYEDDDILVVNKPAGLVVHPGTGTAGTTTLVEALLATRSLPPSDNAVRPGIVHRIDKETTGILVVATSPRGLESLKHQFASRSIKKTYLAWVAGPFEETEGRIEAPLGRDPRAPRRMAVLPGGRDAETEFRVLAQERGRALLSVHPRTGRTHQIRVHLKYIGHPVAGDRLYGGPAAQGLLLHAWKLELTHPASGERMTFEAPPPSVFPASAYSDPRSDRAASK